MKVNEDANLVTCLSIFWNKPSVLSMKVNVDCNLVTFLTDSLVFLQNIEAYRDERDWIMQSDAVIQMWEDQKCQLLRRIDVLSVVIRECKDRLG